MLTMPGTTASTHSRMQGKSAERCPGALASGAWQACVANDGSLLARKASCILQNPLINN